MIRKMASVYLHGQIVVSILDNGRMGNSMVKVNTKTKKVLHELESGSMVNVQTKRDNNSDNF